MIGDQDELMMKKALAFCEFFLSYKLEGVNTKKLRERCKKHLEDLYNLHNHKRIAELKD